MKKSLLILSMIAVSAVSKAQQSCSLDSSFGLNGFAHTDVHAALAASIHAVAQQPDGKLVVTGRGQNAGTKMSIPIVRYNVDGSLDNSFGTAGIATKSFDSLHDEGNGIAVQPDGKILVTGEYGTSGHAHHYLGRYLSTGVPDSSFAVNGFATDTSLVSSFSSAVLLQPDGKILIGGYQGFMQKAFVARYLTNGALDSSFGANGYAITTVNTTALSSTFQGADICRQPDGKILLTGYLYLSGGDNDFVLIRYNSNGSPDSTFGTNGITVTDIGYSDHPYKIGLQSTGAIVVVGSSSGVGVNHNLVQMTTVRYTPGGILDAGFGNNGIVSTVIDSGQSCQGYTVLIQPDDKIIVGGDNSYTPSPFIGATYSFAMVRLTANGSVDSSFGINGVVQDVPDTATMGFATCGMFQADGKIVLGGSLLGATIAPGQFGIARYKFSPGLGMSGVPNKQITISAYPNPADRLLNIDYTIEQPGATTAMITDMNGKTVKTLWKGQKQSGFQHHVAELDNTLPAGLYNLTLTINGKAYATKIFKK